MSEPKPIEITPFWMFVAAVILTLLTLYIMEAYGREIPSGRGLEIILVFIPLFAILAWAFVVIHVVARLRGYTR